jgi:hypothetical protein
MTKKELEMNKLREELKFKEITCNKYEELLKR